MTLSLSSSRNPSQRRSLPPSSRTLTLGLQCGTQVRPGCGMKEGTSLPCPCRNEAGAVMTPSRSPQSPAPRLADQSLREQDQFRLISSIRALKHCLRHSDPSPKMLERLGVSSSPHNLNHPPYSSVPPTEQALPQWRGACPRKQMTLPLGG